MSHLLESILSLIQNSSVEWKPLGEAGEFVRGNGLPKSDFTESGVPAIHYGQIYTYYGNSTTETKSFVSPESAKKLKKVDKGDVVITNTSENLEDVGKALLYLGEKQAVTGGHATIFKPSKEILGKYFVYYTQTLAFAIEKKRYAKGTKVIDVSATDMAKIKIPIPPLHIQAEIVRILDAFTAMQAELQAELTARKKQYNYYRNFLLTFEKENTSSLADERTSGRADERTSGRADERTSGRADERTSGRAAVRVEWKTLGELGEFVRGNGLQKSDFAESGIGCIHYGQIYTYYGTFAYKTKSFVSPVLATKLRKAQKGDLIIATTSENIEDVCKPLVWLGDDEICVSGETYVFKHNQNPKYLAYYLQTPIFFDFKKRNRTGTKVIRVHGDKLAEFKVPIPSPTEQARIVAILDKFDALTNSITQGLPREIELRQQQYAYYRDLLLSFSKGETGTAFEGN